MGVKLLAATPDSPWYRLADMMRLYDCSARTVWTWVSEGRIPAPVRNGPRWTRWAKSVVDAHVASMAKGRKTLPTLPADALTLSEAVAVGKALEAMERPKAKEREAAGRKKGKEPPRVENFSTREKGRALDKVGKAIGISRITYQPGKEVTQCCGA